jgi:hypothetical protein
MIKQTEDKIQEQIFSYFNNKYCLKHHNPSLVIHATPNGGSRNLAEAIKMCKTGTLAGVADLTIKGVESRFIDIEVKLPNAKQTPKQILMESKLKTLNSNYIVVYSLEDFINKIEPFINFLTIK